MMNIEEAKRDLRGRMRARRHEVSAADAERAGLAAAAWICDSQPFRAARNVALYVAIAGEVDTRELIAAAMAAGKGVCVPRGTGGSSLEFARLDELGELRSGEFGVPEPPRSAERVVLSVGDLVIVPGVAFDALGRRLGRGGGHYDRAFPPALERPPILIGLAFSFQVVAEVPSDCHDRRMDAVCTDEGLRFALEQSP